MTPPAPYPLLLMMSAASRDVVARDVAACDMAAWRGVARPSTGAGLRTPLLMPLSMPLRGGNGSSATPAGSAVAPVGESVVVAAAVTVVRPAPTVRAERITLGQHCATGPVAVPVSAVPPVLAVLRGLPVRRVFPVLSLPAVAVRTVAQRDADAQRCDTVEALREAERYGAAVASQRLREQMAAYRAVLQADTALPAAAVALLDEGLRRVSLTPAQGALVVAPRYPAYFD